MSPTWTRFPMHPYSSLLSFPLEGGEAFGSSRGLMLPDTDEAYLSSATDPGSSPMMMADPGSTGALSPPPPVVASDPPVEGRQFAPTGNPAVDRTIRMRQILVRMRQEGRSGRPPVSPASSDAAAARRLLSSSQDAAGARAQPLQQQSRSRSAWEPWLLPLQEENFGVEDGAAGISTSPSSPSLRRKMLITKKEASRTSGEVKGDGGSHRGT